jgi:tetratricopeptide (TPR) repeat protein
LRLGCLPLRRKQRQQAYAKLLEGQRYIWSIFRTRTGRQNNARLASLALQESVALDPTLSEGYTALAELALNTQPRDVDESIRLAQLSTRVNPNNFGARRILGRLHSYQARLVGGPFDASAANQAITEWKQVVRLDPRNAEAWAFLSELYERTGKNEESIDALRKWIASATPIDSQFYQMLMGGESLGPETATLKLGEALLKAGRTREAIETTSTLVVDEPANLAAVELLSDAVEGASAAEAGIAIDALRQAVYANPTSPSLVNLLAQVYSRVGQIEEAATLLRSTSEKLQATDRASAASFNVTLADIYARAERTNDAIVTYDSALKAYGLVAGDTLSAEERDFVTQIFEKMIQTQKSAGRFADARTTIERSRTFLGKTDLFADRHAINLARETGIAPRLLRPSRLSGAGPPRMRASSVSKRPC